jgi:hypothetical protein
MRVHNDYTVFTSIYFYEGLARRPRTQTFKRHKAGRELYYLFPYSFMSFHADFQPSPTIQHFTASHGANQPKTASLQHL